MGNIFINYNYPKTFAVGKYNFDDLASAVDTYVRGNSNPQGGRPEFFGPTPNADRVREYIKTDSQIEEKDQEVMVLG